MASIVVVKERTRLGGRDQVAVRMWSGRGQDVVRTKSGRGQDLVRTVLSQANCFNYYWPNF